MMPRRTLVRIAIFSAIALTRAAAGAAEGDWPAWRGPHSNGIAQRTSFPETWPTGKLTPLWTAATAEGWSSPVVADGRVFITDRDGAVERVTAFDAASGKQLWQQTNPVDFDPHPVGRRHGSGPKSTPVVSGEHVYTLGIAGWLQCLKVADGTVVWKHFLPLDYGVVQPLPGGRTYVNREIDVVVPVAPGQGAAVPLFGYTGSPVVDGNLLITPVGQPRGGTIMAFDKLTGAVAWQALSENVSYASPVVAEIGGVRQVVVPTGPNVVGLAVADGRLLWSFEYQNQYDETIGTPVVADDVVLITAVGRPLTAHRITATDGRFAVAEMWKSYDLESYLSSMIAVDGHVYGMNDGGEWNCLRISDGKHLWRGGGHGYYCTPLLVDRRLLGLNEKGQLEVLAADPTAYQKLALCFPTTDATWTSPAVVGNRLYIRSRTAVACYEIR